MAKKDEVEHEPLTEEQRITALENRVGTNKVVLIIVALSLVVAITVSITIFTVASLEEEVEPIQIEVIDDLRAEIVTLNKTIESQNKRISDLKKQLPLLEEMVESSSNVRLRAIVMEQEKAHLEFLEALQSGMYDLAHMVPGSRTWLEVYGEKMDLAKAHAQARVSDIKNLGKETKVTDEEEDPFSDGF